MRPDAFDALGLEPRFDLSREDIERNYLARVVAIHPDGGLQHRADDSGAAALNDARAVLLDPERRASVLLARLGGPSAERDKSLPPEFLAEMMTVREEMESALTSGDLKERDRWRVWARERRALMIAEVSAAFNAITPGSAPAAMAMVRRSLNAWRYIERMVQQLEGRPR